MINPAPVATVDFRNWRRFMILASIIRFRLS